MTSYPDGEVDPRQGGLARAARPALAGLRAPLRRDGARHARRAPRDRGPWLYRERRISRGREFDLLKFRTLRRDVLARMDSESHARMHEADEANLTWAGRRLLKPWYLDELPQIWNVLRGRHEPRRAATVAAVDGGDSGRRGVQLPERVRRRLDRPGAGRRRASPSRPGTRSSTSPTSTCAGRPTAWSVLAHRSRNPLANGRRHGKGEGLQF